MVAGTEESEVVALLRQARVLPVLSIEHAEQAVAVCKALVAGGIRCVEITFRTTAAAEAIERVSRIEGLLVGAGTVLSATQAQAAFDAGARFAVAPGTNADVVAASRGLGLEFFPGVASASEIDRAHELGCDVVKVFPASTVGGPAFLRAVAAVYPQARFIPTGGIDAGSLRDYLAVPAVLACGGSWLCDQALVQGERFDELERLARAALEAAA